ncbi:NifU family protein [Clostridium pasteurianum]|uniref:Thioredoxin-like protein n=1 Tax=Clostridium pasteurianum BC1 TaxID=86416 RepID=R4KEI6_CLOPA|nr:NifU family protein [Clostridium pasteurianum]AGK98979.1 thioredoxin-like protein [Clostridium pasteurianum BC1]
MRNEIIEVLDEIRPALQRDGGDVKFIDVTEDGVVKVELQGSCSGCPFSQMTVKNLIETELKNKAPEVKAVVGV